MKLINLKFRRPDPKIVEAFREVGSATAHEAMGRKGNLDYRIRQLYPGMKVCGPAMTCRCYEMDNMTIHAAAHYAKPGDVLVVTMGGYPQQGPFGECMSTLCQTRGIEGLVIDSGVRDGEQIKKLGFPIFSDGHCVNGTIKENFGNVGYPISIGGQVVNPGDIVIGDDDGVVVVPLEKAEEILKLSQQRLADEIIIRDKFRHGLTSWMMGNRDKAIAKGFDVIVDEDEGN